jgi:tetratricopeptide (TPR) repeat protein
MKKNMKDLVIIFEDFLSGLNLKYRSLKTKIWLRGLAVRVERLWGVSWLRNLLILIPAALIISYWFEEDWVKIIGGARELLTPFEGSWWILLLFCIFMVTAVSISRSLTRLKGLKSFLLFLAGLFFVKFYSLAFLRKIPSLRTKIITEITTYTIQEWFQLIGLILLGIFLFIFFRWLSSSGGIIILPFSESNKENKNQLGEIIADLLATELHRIYRIHNLFNDGGIEVIEIDSSMLSVCRENLNLRLIKGESLTQDLSQSGSIQVGKIGELNISSMLLTIQQLWPWGSIQVISGSILKRDDNSIQQLAARYEKANYHSSINAYTVSMTSTSSSELTCLVRDLAYQIAFDSASEPISTSSWEAFKYFSEALSYFYDYVRTKYSYSLEKALSACEAASKKDKSYKQVAVLLSVISFSYLNRGYKKDMDLAKKAINKALEISPNNSSVQRGAGANCYALAQFEQAIWHYEHAKKLQPEIYETYIRTGMVRLISTTKNEDKFIKSRYKKARNDFLNSLILSPNNAPAQSALAWLDFLCYENNESSESKNGREQTLESAHQRLKNIPEDRMSYVDHSNLAIVLLSKINEEFKSHMCMHESHKLELYECFEFDDGIKLKKKEIYDNWFKALQMRGLDYELDLLDPYSILQAIFYKLLIVAFSQDVLDKSSLIEEVQKLFAKVASVKCLIEGPVWGLLEDSKIIRNKCRGMLSSQKILDKFSDLDDFSDLRKCENMLSNFGKLNDENDFLLCYLLMAIFSGKVRASLQQEA